MSTRIKTTADLRAFLIEEMIATAQGMRESSTAKAVCNYAQQIYNTINMEIKYAHARAKHGAGKLEPVHLYDRDEECVDANAKEKMDV
jgi:hypothetical protein